MFTVQCSRRKRVANGKTKGKKTQTENIGTLEEERKKLCEQGLKLQFQCCRVQEK